MSIEEITDQDFNNKISEGVVLVDFWAQWCAPCRAIAPILSEISEEMTNINIVKVNVEENQEIATEYGITSVPTLLIFKDGDLVERTMGASTKDNYKAMLNKHLS